MSNRALNWAWLTEDLSPTERFVLICLADHHNKTTGLCFPKIERIAERTGLGISTVMKAIRTLELKGKLSRYPWHGRSAYLLAIVEPEKATESQSEAPKEPAHRRNPNLEPKTNPDASLKNLKCNYKAKPTLADVYIPDDALPNLRVIVQKMLDGHRESDLRLYHSDGQIRQAARIVFAAYTRIKERAPC